MKTSIVITPHAHPANRAERRAAERKAKEAQWLADLKREKKNLADRERRKQKKLAAIHAHNPTAKLPDEHDLATLHRWQKQKAMKIARLLKQRW